MSYGPQHITKQILSDLDEINQNSSTDLEEIVNTPLVITGASGFVGTWLTLSWASAYMKFGGTGKLLVTSRNPTAVAKMALSMNSSLPIFALQSDIRKLHIPSDFRDGSIIHAATPASASMNVADPMAMLNVIMEGQGRVLFEAKRTSNRLLFLSSGAVYGKQPLLQEQLPETWNGGPSLFEINSAYHEGKRVAELMANIATDRNGISVTSARLFAFLSPYLPFGTHFAAGNFMKDALEKSEIEIKSGGGSIRSYQYATDLCSSLWALLARGTSGTAYNVGSVEEVTILQLAHLVKASVNISASVEVRGVDTSENVTRYVPSIQKITSELGVENRVGLVEAISRTAKWSDQVKEKATQ